MRLIDADELMDELENEQPLNWTDSPGEIQEQADWERFKGMVSVANTIEAEPVRHGRWETEMDDMGWLKHTCPNCGYVKRTDIHVSLGWNYCPICGTNMDLEE